MTENYLSLKRPLNMMDNPVYPQFTKPEPRWKSAGKHWKVDSGVLLDKLDSNFRYYDHHILFQSRDYAQYKYGQRTYTGEDVNRRVILPLTDMREKMKPIQHLQDTGLRTTFSTAKFPKGIYSFNKPITPLQEEGTISKQTKTPFVDKTRGTAPNYTIGSPAFVDVSKVKQISPNVENQKSGYLHLKQNVVYNQNMYVPHNTHVKEKQLPSGVIITEY